MFNYLPTYVSNVKMRHVITMFWSQLSHLQGGSAMVKDLTPQCEGEGSSPHNCNLTYLS
jgi:hypothetical protein